MEYETLLEELYKQLKPVKTEERFEVPKVSIFLEGNKTVITNFSAICSVLRREPAHLGKFLSRELAAPFVLEPGRLVLIRRLRAEQIDEKIQQYIKEFVICRECGKPDTELVKEDKFMFLHCLACGAKHSVRAKII